MHLLRNPYYIQNILQFVKEIFQLPYSFSSNFSCIIASKDIEFTFIGEQYWIPETEILYSCVLVNSGRVFLILITDKHFLSKK